MFIKRKKLKLLIVCGIFLFFYLYIFISSSRIDIFLSRSHQGNSLNGHNKTKVKSPFEGPVEDLLGGEFRINREHNDVINEDKKTNDHGWKKGFRVGAGFQNPLLNVGEVIEEKADDPMDGIEDEIIEDNLGHPKARAVKGPEFKPLQPIADKRSKKKKGHRKSDEDCCIEVKKKQKLYLHVTYPPFIQFGKPGDPGEDGQSVRWRPDELTRNESLQKEKDFNVHYFDEWTSRKIAVHRSLLDQRGPESPTMPGGLYAVSREWFSKLGKYDPEMDFWGGENIEMSFKTWMCGGSLLLSVCSHVGHIFRNINPNIGGIRLTYKNSIRVAEVWMDQYKHFFYEKLGYNIPDYGDVTSRVLLRKSLNCSDFGWYLQHVFPELKKSMDVFGHYYGESTMANKLLMPEAYCFRRQC
uniref:Galactosyltransferase C-terminal domain-containing protein n=1 Tax=Biomphalaria glabrata TaxID=6526 RepID=A0A2C9KRV1_BIOGL